MLRDLLREHSNESIADRIILGAVPTALRATSAIVGGSAKIAGKGLGLAGKFSSSVIGGFLGGGSKITKSLVDRTIKITKAKGKKNPHYSSIGASGRIVPVRKGDGNADIIAKMYSFMVKVREEEHKTQELKRNFELEQREEDERRHKKLVDAIVNMRKGEVKPKEEQTKGKSVFDTIFSVFGKIKNFASSIVSFISNMMGKLLGIGSISSGIFSQVGKLIGNLISGLSDLIFPVVKTLLISLLPKLLTRVVGGAMGFALRPALAGVATGIGIAGASDQIMPTIDARTNLESLQGTAKEIDSKSNKTYSLLDPITHTPIDVKLSKDQRSNLEQLYKDYIKVDSDYSKPMSFMPGTEDWKSKTKKKKDILDSILSIFQDAIKQKIETGMVPATSTEKTIMQAESSAGLMDRTITAAKEQTQNLIEQTLTDKSAFELPEEEKQKFNELKTGYIERSLSGVDQSLAEPIRQGLTLPPTPLSQGMGTSNNPVSITHNNVQSVGNRSVVDPSPTPVRDNRLRDCAITNSCPP